MKSLALPAALFLVAAGIPGTLHAAPLNIASVHAPAINCKFDLDCKVTVTDFVDHFALPAAAGEATLQSRMFPAGEAGTAGAGLYAYLYRIDLGDVTGITALPCVHEVKIEFGPIASIDYDGDGDRDDVFVVTGGGVGTVAPASAETDGRFVTLKFDPPVCAGSSPGTGKSSFFIGLASKMPPRPVTATVRDTLGGETAADARAPKLRTTVPLAKPFLRGDANGSGVADIADAIATLGSIFLGKPALPCLEAADSNDDGGVDISDAVWLLSHLFLGGPRPSLPFGVCGIDPTPDPLGCEQYSVCPADTCPNLAVESIEFEIVSRSSDFAGRVRVTATLRDVGGPYDSGEGQQMLVLYEKPLGGTSRLVASQAFVDLAPGGEVTVSYVRDWDSASPGEGEFPPDYRALFSYDPDLFIDGNDRNDDCVREDDSLERSGSEINDLFR